MAIFKKKYDEFTQYDEQKKLFYIARAHWIQLFKVNMQHTIIAQTFLNIIDEHPHLKPYWIFMRTSKPFETIKVNNVEDDTESLDEDVKQVISSGVLQDSSTYITANLKINNEHKFNNHISTVQAAITIMMDNVDDYKSLIKVIREFGSYHFFYEAFEPHFELFHTYFMITAKKLLVNTTEEIDKKIEESWNALFEELKENMSYGVALQRHTYLKTAITIDDMLTITNDWEKIEMYGLDKIGDLIYNRMKFKYIVILKNMDIELPTDMEEEYKKIKEISHQLIYGLQIAIQHYSFADGFASLPELLTDFTFNHALITICPMVFRKAFNNALIYALTIIMGDNNMKECKIHVWGKLYRILEQAIMTNVARM
ncbi:Globin-like domain and Globin, structural domain-containing protein [Strongyloides ratti]|uniref:Globin-like domain and Globin, structural domain-containing protein n=1 Tax=Strongyloides ratti TaxID=34506 RepID=A0A090LKD3_STRRB|nr:Globin-like domain and Globin, structural domain-containing protein [Strongyloides ratti]CEF70163.1 Globin-like domain and Globin, structural domain-containing protein [Strongyloides ratti]